MLLSTLPSGFGEALVASGISSPTAMEFSPDGRLFVLEKSGAVRVIKNGALLAQPFVTLPVDTFGERGLGGIAFDPDFANNQHVYLYYTATTPTTHNRLSRFTANGDVAQNGSETVLLDLPDPTWGGNIHNGGSLRFAADGHLFVTVGDHGSSPNGQSMTTPFGKILRIEPDGSIPEDNPFFGSATGINRAIWSLGLRNPFTTAIRPSTGQLYVNDVGQDQWEEINIAAAGANYGWATTEGPFNEATYPDFVNPIYAYSHAQGYAIIGGAFYEPASPQFPAQYAGKYFFADYVFGWLKTMDPATNVVSDFGTGLNGPVDFDVGPDGALYYLSRGDDAVFKIVATSAPQISHEPASHLISVGQPVTFSVTASGQAPLTYQWRRDGIDISGETDSTYTIASVVIGDDNAVFDCVVTNGQGSATSSGATLDVTTDQPPVPVITSPSTSLLYHGGQTISFGGSATDNEDGTIPSSSMTWWVDFHHNVHFHPFVPAFTGTGGTFDVPLTGETSANVWYRVHLRVTDSAGFVRETYQDVLPKTATITIASSQPGLQIGIDSQPKPTPIVIEGVSGMVRMLSAAQVQTLGGVSYEFVSWSDSGMATHNIVFPDENTTYTATYAAFTESYVSDLNWTGTVGPTPTKDTNQYGGTITIDGTAYSKGLGVTPTSEITYALGGVWDRFIADVGRDDAWGSPGLVGFEVWVDGVKQYDSGPLTGASPIHHIDVSVAGGQSMTLICRDLGAGGYISSWGSARLRANTGMIPTAPSGAGVTSSVYNRVSVSWADHSGNEAGFRIERSSDGTNFTEIATVGAGVTSYLDAPVSAGTQYWYRVKAYNAIGTSSASNVATVTTPASTLPPGWGDGQVGLIPPASTGSASFAGAAFTLTGVGRGVRGEQDEFYTVYRTLTGDGEIVARVVSVQATDLFARGGVIMRDSLDGGSKTAMSLVAPLNGGGLFYRTSVGGDTGLDFTGILAMPHWVRLVRTGNDFSGYYSADGTNWTLFGTHTIAMGATIYVGVGVMSGQQAAFNTAVFDNVSVTNAAPTVATPASATPSIVIGTTTMLSARGDDDGGEALLGYTWSVLGKPVGADDPLFSVNGTHAARDTVAAFSRAGEYTLRVTISDGFYSVTSDVVVTVAQTLTNIVISPVTVTLGQGATQQFAASAKDQFGQSMTAVTIAWSASSGGVDANGLYTAPMNMASVTVTATSGAVSGQANVTVSPAAPTVATAANSTPGTVTGLSALLGVLGASELGEAALAYTWAVTLKPPGSSPTFSINGTNAAKATTITFDRAGAYTIVVTISDGTQSVVSELDVTVAQTLTSVIVTPVSGAIAAGATRQFSGVARDQFGQAMDPQPTFDWQAAGGSIAASGLFTAGATGGTFAVSAGASSVVGSASVTIDASGPVGTLGVDPAPTVGDSSWTFHVTFTDLLGVDVATLDGAVIVRDPNGAAHSVVLLGVDVAGNGSPRTVTYQIDAPDGIFDFNDQGVWTIELVSGAAKDVAGQASAFSTLGAFAISASFATLSGGVLTVNGTAGDDLLAISATVEDVSVSLGAVTLDFDASLVDSIVVNGLAGNDSLSITGPVDSVVTFDDGEGADTISLTGGGATLDIGAEQELAGLSIDGATLGLAGTGTLTVGQLAIAAASGLDVGLAAMVVRGGEMGSWDGSAYTGLTGLVAVGRASIDGEGIFSSIAAVSEDFTAVGVARAGDVLGLSGTDTALWRGQTVSAGDVLLMYTYNGDANLSGFLDVDDYGQIDFNASTGGALPDWFNGDFNLDGIQDVDDYGLIDFVIGIQGPPL